MFYLLDKLKPKTKTKIFVDVDISTLLYTLRKRGQEKIFPTCPPIQSV